jgi:hypothetical protein
MNRHDRRAARKQGEPPRAGVYTRANLERDALELEYMRPLLATLRQISACYYCRADFSEAYEPELLAMLEGDGKNGEFIAFAICEQCAASPDVAININELRREGRKAMK